MATAGKSKGSSGGNGSKKTDTIKRKAKNVEVKETKPKNVKLYKAKIK